MYVCAMHIFLIHVTMMHIPILHLYMILIHACMMNLYMIRDPDTCMYDAHICDPWSLTLMHVCMMHISMILNHACMYCACIYDAAEILSRTDQRTDEQGDSGSRMDKR